MRASEVAEQIRAEHAELRGMLTEIDALAAQFEGGSEEAGRLLRARGLALYERFQLHLELEEQMLKPLLASRGLDAEVRHLDWEHKEQRELIEYLLRRLSMNQNPTSLVARELRNFSEYLRLDMAHEEATLLPGVESNQCGS